MVYVHELTVAQKDAINGHALPSGGTVIPQQDADGKWILSQETADQVTDPNFLWVQSCPLIPYSPPPIDL